MAQVEVRQLKKLRVFNSLKLSIVVTTKVLTDITADVTTDITTKAITGKLGYYSRGLNIN